MKLAFDLHLHSCLSPCASDDMTPANMAAMCALAGLQVVALTDHNTAGNCAAFLQAAQRNGLLALPGMELCTREEVHVVCLFPDLEGARAFSDHVALLLPPIQNKSQVFGNQILMDSEDGVLGEETLLLAGAADLGLGEAAALAASCGGLAYPAHIDRPSNSLLSQLGLWDPDLNFPLAEVSPYCPPDLFDRADLKGLRHVTGCDAHDLERIPDAHQYMEVPEPSPRAVLDWLAGRSANLA
jgi:hypothetical protein